MQVPPKHGMGRQPVRLQNDANKQNSIVASFVCLPCSLKVSLSNFAISPTARGRVHFAFHVLHSAKHPASMMIMEDHPLCLFSNSTRHILTQKLSFYLLLVAFFSTEPTDDNAVFCLFFQSPISDLVTENFVQACLHPTLFPAILKFFPSRCPCMASAWSRTPRWSFP
jgi:hypothetical protein